MREDLYGIPNHSVRDYTMQTQRFFFNSVVCQKPLLPIIVCAYDLQHSACLLFVSLPALSRVTHKAGAAKQARTPDMASHAAPRISREWSSAFYSLPPRATPPTRGHNGHQCGQLTTLRMLDTTGAQEPSHNSTEMTSTSTTTSAPQTSRGHSLSENSFWVQPEQTTAATWMLQCLVSDTL